MESELVTQTVSFCGKFDKTIDLLRVARMVDSKQTSLRTKDETRAKSLLNAWNEAQPQPALNLHLARAYPRKLPR